MVGQTLSEYGSYICQNLWCVQLEECASDYVCFLPLSGTDDIIELATKSEQPVVSG